MNDVSFLSLAGRWQRKTDAPTIALLTTGRATPHFTTSIAPNPHITRELHPVVLMLSKRQSGSGKDER
jgi:hypothetical protein